MKRKTRPLKQPVQPKEVEERTPQQIVENLTLIINEYTSECSSRMEDLTLRDLVAKYISEANSGSLVAARRLLYLAMDCTQWLSSRVASEDPTVFALSKTVSLWPCLVDPVTRQGHIPPDVGAECGVLDREKALDRESIPKYVAIHLLKITEGLHELAKAQKFAALLREKKAELESFPEFQQIEEKLGIERYHQTEQARWDSDVNFRKGQIEGKFAEFAKFLDIENSFQDETLLDEYVIKSHRLPDPQSPGSNIEWWKLAKEVFLRATNNHPEQCLLFREATKASVEYYLRTHEKGDKNAFSTQKSTIIGRTRKAFSLLFKAGFAKSATDGE